MSRTVEIVLDDEENAPVDYPDSIFFDDYVYEDGEYDKDSVSSSDGNGKGDGNEASNNNNNNQPTGEEYYAAALAAAAPVATESIEVARETAATEVAAIEKETATSEEKEENTTKNEQAKSIYVSAASLSSALFASRRIMYEFQFEDVVRMVCRDRHSYVVSLECGLGKTTEAWALIQNERHRRLVMSQPWTPALIVAPKSLLCNWQAEARDYVFGEHRFEKKVCVYHGTNRHRRLPSANCIVILTTYDVVRIDSAREEGFLPHIPHFSVVVADEAHVIRNVELKTARAQGKEESAGSRAQGREDAIVSRVDANTAKTAAAVCALSQRSDLRYALTATPFVNRESDLIALAKFISEDGNVSHLLNAPSENARDRRLNTWIAQNMIIRRKADLNLSQPLPPKRFCVNWLQLGTLEMTAYEMCVNDIETLLEKYDGNMRACSGHLLALITRLRQLCLSVMVVTEPENIAKWHESVFGSTGSEEERLKKDRLLAADAEQRLLDEVKNSTKLRCLVCDVYRCLYSDPSCWKREIEKETEEENRREEIGVGEESTSAPTQTQQETNERIVVASESKVFLKLLQLAVQSRSVRAHCRFDHLPVPLLLLFTGEVHALRERDALLKQFNEAPRPVVLLLTRPCGGVGLNLFRARHMLVADAWWNPAAIIQLTDRIHRFGQRREVFILRYPVQGSIEEFLLSHEQRKGFVASQYVGNDNTRLLAQLRYEAIENRGSGSMLKDIVGFLYSKNNRTYQPNSSTNLIDRLLHLVRTGQRENVAGKRVLFEQE